MKYNHITKQIEDFIREQTKGLGGGVIGLSGGIDSTLVAYLAVNALGKDRVHGLIMPYETSKDTDDALQVTKILNLSPEIFNITSQVDLYQNTGYFHDKISKGNLMARTRMCLLYGIANEKNMLVLGTSNKSEIGIGYFTKYGDGGVDIEPIGDLYKTEVRELAKFLGIPDNIIYKDPSAGLWEGQTDEEELGIDYITLDKFLKIYEESDIISTNSEYPTAGIMVDKLHTQTLKWITSKDADKIIKMIKKTEHKRKIPPIFKLKK